MAPVLRALARAGDCDHKYAVRLNAVDGKVRKSSQRDASHRWVRECAGLARLGMLYEQIENRLNLIEEGIAETVYGELVPDRIEEHFLFGFFVCFDPHFKAARRSRTR